VEAGGRLSDLPGELRRFQRGRLRRPQRDHRELDYLTALGVDAVWLSPIYPTPWDDSGYDIADYQDIDSRFETLGDFDALLTPFTSAECD
jgi:maltooligosyltrehalose synthase